MGAFALGNVLGWTAQVVPKIKESYVLGFYVTESEGNWMSGLMALGAMVSVVPIGWLIDAIGRKYSMFSLVPIFTVGWALIAWSSSVSLLLSYPSFLIIIKSFFFNLFVKRKEKIIFENDFY